MSVTTVGASHISSGLSVLDPLTALPNGFQVTGHKYPIITKTLAPGEEVRGEPGSMIMMDDKVKMSVGFASGGVMGALKAAVGGDMLVNTYKNKGSEPGQVSMAGSQPFGSLMAVNIDEQGKFYAKPGAYFAGDTKVKISSKWLKPASCAACCCGGMPPIMQYISGEGMAFLLGSGTIVTKKLEAGEKMIVSTGALLGFSNSITFDVMRTGSCFTCCFGGEGCYNTTLQGPGDVYLQSFSTDKLKQFMMMQLPQQNKGAGGDGGAPPESEAIER